MTRWEAIQASAIAVDDVNHAGDLLAVVGGTQALDHRAKNCGAQLVGNSDGEGYRYDKQ